MPVPEQPQDAAMLYLGGLQLVVVPVLQYSSAETIRYACMAVRFGCTGERAHVLQCIRYAGQGSIHLPGEGKLVISQTVLQ